MASNNNLNPEWASSSDIEEMYRLCMDGGNCAPDVMFISCPEGCGSFLLTTGGENTVCDHLEKLLDGGE